MHATFTPDQQQRIAESVAQAEARTEAEIVPIVARHSGRYDRAEDIAGLWLGGLAMVVAWSLFPREAAGDWPASPRIVEVLCLLLSLVVGFALGALLAARVTPLRRLFTSRRQMCDEVDARARAAFFDTRVHHTHRASGVLVFISLFERRAVILADELILAKLGSETIESLCDELTAQLGRQSLIEALCATIASLGEKLAPLLPRETDDVNELADALVVVD